MSETGFRWQVGQTLTKEDVAEMERHVIARNKDINRLHRKLDARGDLIRHLIQVVRHQPELNLDAEAFPVAMEDACNRFSALDLRVERAEAGAKEMEAACEANIRQAITKQETIIRTQDAMIRSFIRTVRAEPNLNIDTEEFGSRLDVIAENVTRRLALLNTATRERDDAKKKCETAEADAKRLTVEAQASQRNSDRAEARVADLAMMELELNGIKQHAKQCHHRTALFALIEIIAPGRGGDVNEIARTMVKRLAELEKQIANTMRFNQMAPTRLAEIEPQFDAAKKQIAELIDQWEHRPVACALDECLRVTKLEVQLKSQEDNTVYSEKMRDGWQDNAEKAYARIEEFEDVLKQIEELANRNGNPHADCADIVELAAALRMRNDHNQIGPVELKKDERIQRLEAKVRGHLAMDTINAKITCAKDDSFDYSTGDLEDDLREALAFFKAGHGAQVEDQD